MIRTFSRPLWLLLLVLPGLASAQDRLALVVGIDRYEQVADLQKATNDARAIGDALATVGFDVTALTDVDERSFNRGLDRFISDVKPGDEVVFFFAGHGVEIDGRNYLLPSDAPSGASEMTIRADSIAADQVLGYIQSAGASVAVMILDACRDNPYAGGGRSVGGARGLSIVAAPEGSFVLLSAASGEVAFEGDDSDPNSIFTRALLPLLQEPGLPLPILARRLRSDVQRLASASGKSQRPAYYDEVSGEFMFVSGAASQPVAPAVDPCSRARADWQYVEGSDDPGLLESYIAEHDDCGLFARLAAQQLALLETQQTTSDQASAAVSGAGDDTPAPEPSLTGEAAEYFRRAQAGDTGAMTNLGWMYENGRGVTQSDAEAVRWYRAAAEAGNATAMHNLGWMYEDGRGVTQSDSEAVRWYRAGAEAGDAYAMHNLGWMYKNGRGVTQSDTEAVRWYRAAAQAGDAAAMNNLGRMYSNGSGVTQNDSEALFWFRAGAAAGDAGAMTNLAWMYENGRGVTQSFSSAANQYLSAIKGGDDWSVTNASSLLSGTVREIQRTLKTEGLYSGAIDGVASPETIAAMRGYATR